MGGLFRMAFCFLQEKDSVTEPTYSRPYSQNGNTSSMGYLIKQDWNGIYPQLCIPYDAGPVQLFYLQLRFSFLPMITIDTMFQNTQYKTRQSLMLKNMVLPKAILGNFLVKSLDTFVSTVLIFWIEGEKNRKHTEQKTTKIVFTQCDIS